jgi:RimJ/RimL family protein N-acetyltransferase
MPGMTEVAADQFPAHFTPAVEVGWRLGRSAWGRGYASEAARASIDHGFAHSGSARSCR